MTDPDWSKCLEATHFDPVDQNFLREVGEALLLFNIKRGWTVPLHTVYGLRVEDCNRPLVKRPPWSGEGVPPTGTVCELRNVAAETEWSQATVVFASRNVIVWDWAGEPAINGLCTAYAHAVEMRPIRTPEQISAEERLAAINYMEIDAGISGSAFDGDPEARVWIKNLIDKGYRKPMPATPEDREKAIAEMVETAREASGFGQNRADYAALYDAGYRKQVAP